VYPMAAEFHTDAWLNAPADFSLAALRGRVVLVEVFQLLCPACVSHALPQAQRARQMFSRRQLAVIGLHSVFEHHEVQGTMAALRAFAHEYRLDFPIGLDAADGSTGIPRTMAAYSMQGTPTTLLIDRDGRLCLQHFGVLDDIALGAAIMAAIAEYRPESVGSDPGVASAECSSSGCPRPAD
jgi:thiol-disulfide isomerase/thioredoxin